jgi:hypothetical protein
VDGLVILAGPVRATPTPLGQTAGAGGGSTPRARSKAERRWVNPRASSQPIRRASAA